MSSWQSIKSFLTCVWSPLPPPQSNFCFSLPFYLSVPYHPFVHSCIPWPPPPAHLSPSLILMSQLEQLCFTQLQLQVIGSCRVTWSKHEQKEWSLSPLELPRYLCFSHRIVSSDSVNKRTKIVLQTSLGRSCSSLNTHITHILITYQLCSMLLINTCA